MIKLFFLISYLYLPTVICSICPSIQSSNNILYNDGFSVKNFLRVPKTNVLIVNTQNTKKGDSSIVYYIDMISSSGETINFIKPDYVILELDYIPQIDKFFVLNPEKLIIADPYTLKSVKSIVNLDSKYGFVIPGTQYAAIIQITDQVLIFDTIQANIIKTLDHSKDSEAGGLLQYFAISAKFSFQTSQVIFISTNTNILSWSLDTSSLTSNFNGKVKYSDHTMIDNNFRKVTKHLTQDIIFLSGQPYEIIAIKINSFASNGYQLLMKTNLYNSAYDYVIANMFFVFIQEKPCLILSEGYYVYTIQLDIQLANNKINILNPSPNDYIQLTNFYNWYEAKETPLIMIPALDYGSLFSYETKTFAYVLFSRSDYKSRKQITYKNNLELVVAVYRGDFFLEERKNIGNDYQYLRERFNYSIKDDYNSVYNVKDCQDCLFFKARDVQNDNDYIITADYFPIESKGTTKSIKDTLQLTWDNLNQILDPFFYSNTIWVIVGFPKKSQIQVAIKGLFYLVNAKNPSVYYVLKTSDNKLNKRDTQFAIASIENKNNLEIIGIDVLGTIYIWDLGSANYPLKNTITFDKCLNSEIGEIFYYKQQKKLILTCDDYNVYSVDLQTQSSQQIRKLTSMPHALRVFSGLQIIAIGDKIIGETYIYKFNPTLQVFEFFLKILPGKFTDMVIWIELLKDNTLWIQYRTSDIFYNLQDCIQDSSLCTQCTQQYNFQTTDIQNTNGMYGKGLLDNPYTTSQNFFTAINKAQYYKGFIDGVTDIKVDIIISPDKMMYLSKGLINFDFTSIISINFKSSQQEKVANILYYGEFVLQDYNSANFENIAINFGLDSDNKECGLSFINIKNNVIINNLQTIPFSQQFSQSCYRLTVDRSELTINKYTIDKQIFTDKDFIISTINANKIKISNLIIKNCDFSEQFTILKQYTNIEATIQSLYLINNKCTIGNSNSQNTISLFTAGLFKVNDIHIKDNVFCNKNIFTTITMLEHTNQSFEFRDIEIINNIFYTKTTHILLSIIYAMIQNPDHILTMTNIKFNNNSLKQQNQNNLQTSSFIETNKIAKLYFEQIYLEDHIDIQFGLFETSSDITLNQFYCTNSELYQSKYNNQITSNCIQINESIKVNINKIRIERKNALDKPLFMMTNYLIEQATLDISDGEFKNLILNQSKTNSYASPIYVRSSYTIKLSMDNCHFENNDLQNIEFSLTYSTTGLWVENFVGQVNIKNSSFKSCYSNSKYNFMYIQSNILVIDKVLLQKSSFTFKNEKNLDKKTLYIQEGGSMNIKVNTLSITNSQFSQSTASKGSFLYVQSFGEILKINIINSSFTEGYSSVDGGAFYIDSIGSTLTFDCDQCFFNKIYTFLTSNSAISFEKYAQYKNNKLNQITFKGGSIKNIHGILENYFIYVTYTNLSFSKISEITTEVFNSDSLAHQQYLQTQDKQQSTFVNLISSVVEINDCSITNLKIVNAKSLSPLLVNSQNSNIYFKESTVEKCNFQKSLLKVIDGNLTIEKTQFTNLHQNSEGRNLQETSELTPKSDASSPFILQNAKLKVLTLSSFKDISCLNNCNGGVFQIINGNIDLDQTEISNVESNFGGALFINGINGDNKIKNTNFINCKSLVNGGAVYFKSLTSDKYTLAIENNKYNNNNAQIYGGALYIRSDVLNSRDQNISIQNTEFIGNKAKIGGAINQQNISPLIQNESKFENNIGELYGSDIFSYPQQLFLVNLDQLQKEIKIDKASNLLKIQELRSGDIIKNLSFQFGDSKNKLIKPATSSDMEELKVYLRINPDTENISNYDIRGDLIASYNSKTGYFSFNDITFVGKPETSVIFEAKSDQIYILNDSTNYYEQNYSFKIQIDFRSCIYGEQIKQYNQFIECSVCEEGQFSYDIKQLCQDCPLGATCNGGSNVVTNYGYWRKTENSDLIIECSNLLENCVGGSYGNNICYEGHIGALCEECDIKGEWWGRSYSKSTKYYCTRCDQIKNNVWRVILVIIWTQISMSLAIKGGVNNLKEKIAVQKIQNSIRRRQTSIFSQGVKSSGNNLIRQKATSNTTSTSIVLDNKINFKEDQSGIYIKMFTNYMQIVGSISTFNLKIPTGILEFPQTVGQPLQQSMNSLDCALQQLDSSIPIIYLRLIFSVITPLIYLTIFFIGMTIYHFYKKHKIFPWYTLSTATIFLIIYVQPDLVAQIISSLSCRKIGDTNYILSNVSFECNTEEHNQFISFLIIPLLLLWVFILPIILFLMLRNNRENLDSKEIKLKYGFIYKEYKSEAFYWEFIKMAEKIAIILSLNFYSQNIITKGLLVYMIISIYGILSFIIKPYRDNLVNQVDVNSTNVCAITVLLGVFIYNNKNNQYYYFIYIPITFIILINLWFITKVLKKIIEEYIPKIKQYILPILNKLSQKMNFFRSIIEWFKREKKQRKFNPIIKVKMRKLFRKYLNMSPSEKKKFSLKIIDFQLMQRHGNLFHDNNEENIKLDTDELNYYTYQKQQNKKSLKYIKNNNDLITEQNQTTLQTEELKNSDYGTPLRQYQKTFNDDIKESIFLSSNENILHKSKRSLQKSSTLNLITNDIVITEEKEKEKDQFSLQNIS